MKVRAAEAWNYTGIASSAYLKLFNNSLIIPLIAILDAKSNNAYGKIFQRIN